MADALALVVELARFDGQTLDYAPAFRTLLDEPDRRADDEDAGRQDVGRPGNRQAWQTHKPALMDRGEGAQYSLQMNGFSRFAVPYPDPGA
ncbi:MAG TPA: hypothetical protein PKC03_01635 [Dokdonella sp.]|nr:hypothetical protein [Dokdonella sp.]